ncbi:MAG TPA: malto-oligosyltrehalose trehalohydrolase [Jiangellales bacterium]|nr:malto-oligosyltrehalose trehalohydrolase [Jiangellales bacterium]
MTTFEVWSPTASSVEIELPGGRRPMEPAHRTGWWSVAAPEAGHGTPYAYRVDGGDPLPDPRAVWLPEGVHGPAAVYEHEHFAWSDTGWAGRSLEGAVVYELHVGTFSPEGTFDGVRERLGHLVDLGITHVELMPVAGWDGIHGWGYDGAAPWSVHEPYGGPDGLKRLVDACHGRGLAVLLDVVYNHLGPSGNYLPRFGPYFHDAYHTPWGQAVNLDGPGSDEVRAYLVGNALSWLRDFHLDGLRLDAVHALHDERAIHLLEELSAAVADLSARLGRPLPLVAESDVNDPRVVTPRDTGGLGIDAQWSDDFHHALHALLTGEGQGYYADFAADPWEALSRTMSGAYFHAGTWSSFRGRSHGRPVDVDRLPGWRFLGYLQDHDQVGNRAVGDRVSATLSPGRLACGAALVLTSPFTPMLFMGEEWGAGTPWQYFTSYRDVLGRAVSEGRRREFGEHGWSATDVPDPQDPRTVDRSRLDWTEPVRSPHAELLAWHRDLIRLRSTIPDLADPWLGPVQVTHDARAGWLTVRRGGFRVACNLSGQEQVVPLDAAVTGVTLAWTPAAAEGGGLRLGPESVAIVSVADEPAGRPAAG